jgi:hypothetical protein
MAAVSLQEETANPIEWNVAVKIIFAPVGNRAPVVQNVALPLNLFRTVINFLEVKHLSALLNL